MYIASIIAECVYLKCSPIWDKSHAWLRNNCVTNSFAFIDDNTLVIEPVVIAAIGSSLYRRKRTNVMDQSTDLFP